MLHGKPSAAGPYRIGRLLTWLLAASTASAAAVACRDEATPEPPPKVPTIESAPSQGASDRPALSARGNRRPAEDESRGDPKELPANLSAYQKAMILGDAALYAGQLKEARVQYLKAMELRPDAMAAALGALRSLRMRGHGEERTGVARTVEQKIAEYREQPATEGAAWLLDARLALALGKTGEALDKARLAVTRLKDLGVAWRVLGEAAMAAERWREAVSAFRKAADLGLKARAGTWERMADALDELGQLEEAVAAARKAVELTGDDPNARRRRLNLLAVVLKHAGELTEAYETARRARDLGPTDASVLHNLASIAEARGETERAFELYSKALAGEPVPMTSWRLGHLLLKLDRPNEAGKAFTQAVAHIERWTWPESTMWWPAYDLGKLYARAGRSEDAMGWFADALRQARTPEASREVRSWMAYVQATDDDE